MNEYLSEDLIYDDTFSEALLHFEKMCEYLVQKISTTNTQNFSPKEAIRAMQIINAFADEYNLEGLSMNFNLDSSGAHFIPILKNRLSKILLEENKDLYVNLFNKEKKTLTEEEYKHILNLINDLRIKVKEAASFDVDFQRRLLDKINKLQAELDKTLNSLEILKGRLITVADMINYAHNKALKPVADTVIDVINSCRGIEAKKEGYDVKQIELKEEYVETEIIKEPKSLEESTTE